MTEWKIIRGFENYQVSSDGEVKNSEGKILKPFKAGSGYLQVHLFKDEKRHKKYVHRLVPEAFLLDKAGNEVNHIDGDKHNNSVSNLEWCSRKHNLIHSYYVLKNHVKAVKCIETGIEFPSINEAARQTGFNHTSISMCCDGRQKKTHGLHWGYVV